ncbi:hypothetical protein ES705_27361 [subsurface metagenome]
MARLDLEVTDKMMERLQEKAEAFAVEPSDVAKNMISCALATKGKPGWLDSLTIIVSRVSEIVLAVSRTESEKPKE